VGCTLLLILNGELHEVVKANIIQPLKRNFHSQLMPPNAYMISIVRVLPSYEEVDPPMQPPGAETEVDLGGRLGYMMLWLKDMIRLDHPGTTSNSELPVRSAPPSNPIIASTSTSQKLAEPVGSAPSQEKATMPPVAPSPIADDPAMDDPVEPVERDNMDPLDAFIADFEGPFEVDVPNGCLPDQQLQEKTNVSKHRLSFLSQEMPEDVTADTQTAAANIITPKTLHGLIDKACAEVVSRPKKPWKRAKKDRGVSNSQPVPPAAGKPVKEIRSQDNIPIKGWREYHVAGQPILPLKALKTFTRDMRSLHDSV
jgi:hypothetical protein